MERRRIKARRIDDTVNNGNNILPTKVMDTTDEDDDVCIILQLGEKAITDQLIYCKATILELLRNSPFDGKHSGRPRIQYNKQRIILCIMDKRHVQELIQIRELSFDDESWPITCRVGEKTPHIRFGVLKNLHPSVTEVRIKEELIRNRVKVDTINRINKNTGPTYCVRISFLDNVRPNYITYAGDTKRVYKFHPGVLICNRCSRGGHLAKYCNSTRLRCPLCAEGHGKKDCKIKNKDLSLRRCANCGGAHGASYSYCEYYKNERRIVDVMVDLEIPRHEAKQLCEMDTDLNEQLEIPNQIEDIETSMIDNQGNAENNAIPVLQPEFNKTSNKSDLSNKKKEYNKNKNKQSRPIKEVYAGVQPKSVEQKYKDNQVEDLTKETRELREELKLKMKIAMQRTSMLMLKFLEILASGDNFEIQRTKLLSAIKEIIESEELEIQGHHLVEDLSSPGVTPMGDTWV